MKTYERKTLKRQLDEDEVEPVKRRKLGLPCGRRQLVASIVESDPLITPSSSPTNYTSEAYALPQSTPPLSPGLSPPNAFLAVSANSAKQRRVKKRAQMLGNRAKDEAECTQKENLAPDNWLDQLTEAPPPTGRRVSNFTRRLFRVREETRSKGPAKSDKKALLLAHSRTGQYQSKLLTQARLDFGQSAHVRCPECGMSYTSSDQMDVRLHRRYHDSRSGGLEIGTSTIKPVHNFWISAESCTGGRSRQVRIVQINHLSTSYLRDQAAEILGHVDAEMGATSTPASELWSIKADKRRNRGLANRCRGSIRGKFNLFLGLHRRQCVGLCLVEYLHKADVEVQERHPGGQSNLSPLPPQLLGISRIWTLPSYRRQGIARGMLDCAINHTVYGARISKCDVVFTPPTTGGLKLAQSWLGPSIPVRTYLETDNEMHRIGPRLDDQEVRKVREVQ